LYLAELTILFSGEFPGRREVRRDVAHNAGMRARAPEVAS
jgi:hypothetical protein